MHKWKILLMMIIVIMTFSFIVLRLSAINQISGYQTPSYTMLADLNQKEDTRTVNQAITILELPGLGFEHVTSSTDLHLYLNRSLLNIAIYDERSEYIWFGYYPGYQEKGYTNTIRRWIESGVTIDYFDAATLNEARMSLSHPDSGATITYDMNSQGFKAAINFVKLGISFDLHVQLENDELNVNIPYTSIVEIPYKTAAMKFPKEFKLQSIIVFPYLGSQNHDINGYAMIPDGSGALIRYTQTPYNTAYVKRIYGRDLGIQSNVTSSSHIKPETVLSMPIYGINHGYQQAAFLAEMTSGYGSAELHSYPYMYNQIDINTTFFLYKTRDRSLIQLSGGAISTIPLINKNPYPSDFGVKYAFLHQEQASYSGMAKRYHDHLGLENNPTQTMDMHLEIVGIDQKPSLFGETLVKLTTYKEARTIITDLVSSVDGLMLTYRSYQKGGTNGTTPYRMRINSALGGTYQWKKLMQVINAYEGVSLSLETSPLVLTQKRVFDSQLRKTTLDAFMVSVDSSRVSEGTMLSVTGISERVLKDESRYKAYGITDMSIKDIGNLSFSYQRDQRTVYREQMIEQMKHEMSELSAYHIGIYEPANYFYPYIDRYYQAPYQSNTYAYFSESIPFISLVLSGSVKTYSPLLNYVNDLDMMVLKMIEFNLRPSFIVTFQPGYLLRYTHTEYLYTTEYDVWKDTIKSVYDQVSSILKDVQGERMLSHRYIHEGVVEITYETKTIYVNYQSVAYNVGTLNILPMSAKIVEVSP